MGFNILFALALTAALAHAAAPRDGLPPMPKSEEDGKPIDGYDCSVHRIGNHNHPNECTKFIACNHGGLAYEMDCAECTPGDPRCPEGRTHYNYDADACLWPADAGCSGGGNPTDPTTTPADPTTTPADPTTTPDPGCDPNNCETRGYCGWYEWCERDLKEGLEDHAGKIHWGHLENGTCNTAENLYFDPTITSHGGTCNFWFNLPPEWKEKYNADPECVKPHCWWKELGECSHQYEYYNPDRPDLDGPVVETCPKDGLSGEQLYWNQEKKACLLCSDVPSRDPDRNCC